MKATGEHYNESRQPKGSIPQICPKLFQEFGKIREITRSASMTKNILNKIPDIQYFRNFGEVGITDFQARWEFANYEIKKLSMEF